MPKKKKHWTKVRAEEQAAAAVAEKEAAAKVASVIVAGEPNGSSERPSLGGAIENVRLALAPFDVAVRKKIIKAANSLLG